MLTLYWCLCFNYLFTFGASFAPSGAFFASSRRTHQQLQYMALYNSKKKKSNTASSENYKPNHEKWQPYFDALSKFKDQHGHCNVEEEENPSLYEWLQDQRTSYGYLQASRKTKLTKKRAGALELLGAIPPELMK
jgi:hypothetical protein